MVNQRATEIRFKELTLFTDNLGVISSLAAFFAETSLDSLYIEPETVAKHNKHNKFSTLCWALSAVTISLNLMTLLVAIYTMLHGPALAIRGPAGSMSLAVSRIFVQRRLALRLFWAGLLCKVVQAACLAAWRYPPEAAWPVAAIFVAFIVATYRCIKRVTTKFSFRRFGLRREDFIEIAMPEGVSAQRAAPVAVATSSSVPAQGDVFCGWMMKQSVYLKTWNSRYFTLSATGTLKWSTSTAATSRGSVSLANCDLQVTPISVSTPGIPAFGLAITCRDEKSVHEIIVATDSAETRAQWSRALLSIASRRIAPHHGDATSNPLHPSQPSTN